MKTILKFIGLALLAITLSFTSVDKRTVVIDVSHGGEDMGAQFGDLKEKEIALEIAILLKKLNKDSNLEIILTRDSDKFISLNDRAEFINALNPELVISLHVNNSKDKSLSGTEIFISELNSEKEKSNALALALQNVFPSQKTEIKSTISTS